MHMITQHNVNMWFLYFNNDEINECSFMRKELKLLI